MKLPSLSPNPPAVDTPAGPQAVAPAVAAAPPKQAAAGTTADPAALQQLADKLTETIGMTGQQVQFSVDNDTGKTVLRVTDAESGAVLRQIPGDEALSMARILDRMQGVLIREKA